jgi:hypothetical protein
MNDDTQPRPPQELRAGLSQELPPEFREDLSLPDAGWNGQDPAYYDEEYTQRSGPGCFAWVFVVLFVGLIGVLVVVMAGAAGWTEGKRVADRNIQATSMAFVGRQFTAIETNVADLNSAQLATRIAFLATQTPAIPQVVNLQQTAIAVDLHLTATQEAIINEQLDLIAQALDAGDIAQFEQRVEFLATQTPAIPQVPNLYSIATAWAEQPVQTQETPQPQLTDEPSSPVDQQTPPPAETTSGNLSDINLDELLAKAQQEISLNQLEQATRTLDLIIRLDETYQSQTIRRMIFDVLVQQATIAYQVTLVNPRQTGTLAEAVRLTDQAERYGSTAQLGNLAYERELANLYLNAISAIETADYGVAIRRLELIRAYQTEYKGANINRLIFDQYVAYGDAFANYDRDFCRAAEQYRVALTIFADGSVSGKRDNASAQCQAQQQAQQAPPPQDGTTNEEGVAPIGVPGS